MSNLNPEEVVKQYERAIHKASHFYHRLAGQNPRISYDDVVSEASMVAIKAANSYDETKGTTFHTHLTNALERELKEYLIANGFDLSVTEYSTREAYKADGSLDRLKQEANAHIHLDVELQRGDSYGSYGEILPSGAPSPEDVLIRNENLEILREELDALPDREKYVISLRWFENRTLREIAEEMKVSKQTIHGWERSGISKLEKRLKLRLGNDLY